MSQNILCCGRKLSIEFAIRANGSMPAKDFFDTDLTESERLKFRPPVMRLADDGLVANEERFKKVEGTKDLWEFKLHQVRILGFYMPGARFVLAHGLRKKKDRLSKSDIEVAETIRREHIARQSKG
ncbi:MAG TPA: type II toxin-antitoxin system RelE/ParE family toxin [Candidatus Acidoferrum sp.]|nr:type II toxin-antitoxin system RelE/ParE family toxin [Candidatus Acidoferrum sp.]